jgi:hypothetical protein
MRINKLSRNFGLSLLLTAGASLSLQAYAVGIEVEIPQKGSYIGEEYDTGSIVFELPVTKLGRGHVSAILGGSNAETKLGSFTPYRMVGDETIYTQPSSDGSANYLIVGARATGLLIKGRDLEDYFQLTYNYRTGGTTEWARFDQKTGQSFDPNGGVVVSAGLNFLLTRDFYAGVRAERKLGKNGEANVRFILGGRFR